MVTSAFLKESSLPPAGGQPAQHLLSPHQPTIVGRDPSCTVVLDSGRYNGVSRQHVEIRATSGGIWQIRDLGSSNGTLVNGQPLRGEQGLRSGDRVQLGRNGPEFIFEDPSAPVAAQNIPQTVVYGQQGNYGYSPPAQATPAYNPHNPPAPPPAARPGGNPWPIIVGAFLLLSSAVAWDSWQRSQRSQSSPPVAERPASEQPRSEQPQSERPQSEQPRSGPRMTDPASGNDLEVRGDEVFDARFTVTGEVENVPFTLINENTGQSTERVGLALPVEAKAAFSAADVEFAVQFFDRNGQAIDSAVPVLYSPERERWATGDRAVAVIPLPVSESDRQRIQILEFSR